MIIFLFLNFIVINNSLSIYQFIHFKIYFILRK
jgi:hypothetical protein